MLHDESLVRKFDPDTWMLAPWEADVGLSVIEGGVVEATKLVDAESSVGLPVAVIVYAPAALLATVNAPAKIPFEIVQVWEATAPPAIEQLESEVEYPEPVT